MTQRHPKPTAALTGTGSPEGKVAAPVGSVYTDTAATNGSIRWIKTSGTGATGWKEIGSYPFTRGVLYGASLNDITEPGVYTQGSSSSATPERGYPDTLRGTLYVTDLKGIVSQMYVTSYHPAIWQRERWGSSWGEWNLVTSDSYEEEMGRVIPDGTDWNTLLDNGFYFRPGTSTNDTNSPTNFVGVLLVANGGHSSNACSQLYFASSAAGLYCRGRNASGTWTDWVRLDSPTSEAPSGTPETVMGTGAARREFLISELRDNKGGTIGTDGKAAICFRFDHHTDQFNRLIVPELERLNLPWAQALNSRTQGAGNNTMTWAEMQSLALRTGGEVFNHGATHGDAQDSVKLVDEIVNGRDELRDLLPYLPIVGWMQPGTGGSYGGLQPFSTEDNWTTEAGRMIMAHHAVVYGYKPGIMENLDGQPSIGQCHLSMDNRSYEDIIAEIDRAIATKSGLVLMCHPNYVEEVIADGQLTLSTLTSVMEYVAGKRDNGAVEVVSASGLQFCDVTHSHRRNLVDVSISGTTLTGQRLTTGQTFAANGAHEVYAELTAAGTVTVDIFTPDGVLDVSHTIDVSGTDVKMWLPFTIPVGADFVSLRVTGATSGRATIRPI